MPRLARSRPSSPVARRPLRRLLRGLGWLLLGGALLCIVLVLLLRWFNPPTWGIRLYRAATADATAGQRSHHCWLPLERMGTAMPLAVIAAEDQRFADHLGFDLAELRKALSGARQGERLRGASTLSQQTAKNLFLWPGRSWVRKGLETGFTALLELTWPKRRILEVYLNIVEFGDYTYGVCAAARHHFGVEVARLTPRQAAQLAATLPNPHRLRAHPPSPEVARRAEWILGQIRNLGGAEYLRQLDVAPASPH